MKREGAKIPLAILPFPEDQEVKERLLEPGNGIREQGI